MASILLVEDDEEAIFITTKILASDHILTCARSLYEAKEKLSNNTFDMILLDISMPDGNGFEFLSELKSTGSFHLPVLFLTGNSSNSDQALGFSLGAEDYIVKPPAPIVFKARVEAKLNKYKELHKMGDVFLFGDLKFDIPKYRLTVVSGNSEKIVDLTPIEFRLLLHLSKHEEQVFTRDQLISSVWGNHVHVFDRSIDAHICHIRSKLNDSRCTIQSVHGVGYRLSLRSHAKGSKNSDNPPAKTGT